MPSEGALCALPQLSDLFICGNDFVAGNVLQVLQKMGKSVPEDVLLIVRYLFCTITVFGVHFSKFFLVVRAFTPLIIFLSHMFFFILPVKTLIEGGKHNDRTEI